MANPEHVAILEQGVEAWNAWRTMNPHVVPDLRGEDFIKAELIALDLHMVDLRDALAMAALIASNLEAANVRRANFSGAKLARVCLRDAVLRETDFGGATFASVDLAGAELHGAQFGWTHFGNVNLNGARGLSEVTHEGPSSVGIDTILRSGGHIPDSFLRGCGVNPLIQRLLVGDRESMTTAFYEWVNEARTTWHLPSCFISYCTRDKPFVDRLQKRLNASGVNYWYAPEHGRWGQELTRQIDREIENRDRVILVCSKDSLSSDWVRYEIDQAREQEKARGKTILYPIMLDDAVLTWSDPRASRIREILVGDFRGATKGRAFKEQFGRLMAGLRDEG